MTIVLLAAKSFVIAGGTLLVLCFVRGRSASDRSWIAHLGLAALAALPLGTMLFPPLEVTTSYASVLVDAASASSDAPAPAGLEWLFLAYVVPALLLIARALMELLQLVLVTARARAVTDVHWLEALTEARRRIGSRKRTALLASHEVGSTVSWGALRPKILLNTDAVAAPADADADAILAHELAHIARTDWAKLVLARASVAVFWFNPFAWLLAREAYQLREEAADDAVLAADVEDTTYASLLVSTARLQSNGLALRAHGVAPARKSLAQRVRRVLDPASNRSAGGTRWAAAMAVGAVALTAPLMTLQFIATPFASSVYAPVTSNGEAKLIVFPLRRPPVGAIPMPNSRRKSTE